MDSEHIEQLLERYWKCETSLEEEAQLRAYFAEAGNIPAHLLRYKDLPKHLDSTDALGIAVCHFFNSSRAGAVSESYSGWEAFVRKNPDRVR